MVKQSVIDFDLYLRPSDIIYLTSGDVTVSKTVRGQFYSVTHGDLEEAKKILQQRILRSRQTPKDVKRQRSLDFLNLVAEKTNR